MRGLRSLIVLLVIALPLGWYAYRDSTKPADSGEPKRDKVFSVEADKIEEISLEVRVRRTDPAAEVRQRMEICAAGRRAAGSRRDLQRRQRPRLARDGERRRREPPDLKDYGLAQPRIEVAFKADGKEQTLLIGRRRHRVRSLRQARRRDEGLPDPVASGVGLQQDDLRPARQGGGLRSIATSSMRWSSRQATRPRGSRSRPANGRSPRLSRRGPISAPSRASLSRLTGLQMKIVIVDAPEADARNTGSTSRRHDQVSAAAPRRRRSSSAGRPAKATCTQGICRVRRSSPIESSVLDGLKKDRPNTGRRTSSTPAASMRRGSRSSAPARPTRSRRPRSRTRKARTRRNGGS